jgi:tRNA threonylcarbamoyladenosine biosynthesis protein TsaE
MSRLTLISDSVARTHEIGRHVGAHLENGHVIALIGPLGSGKTTLVKGIAEGAKVPDMRQVNSPTFVIVNEYEAAPIGSTLRIHHVDAYRLRGSDDLEALGFEEMCIQGAVVVEWADRVQELLPADRLTVEIISLSDCRRRFNATAGGPVSEALLARLQPLAPTDR